MAPKTNLYGAGGVQWRIGAGIKNPSAKLSECDIYELKQRENTVRVRGSAAAKKRHEVLDAKIKELLVRINQIGTDLTLKKAALSQNIADNVVSQEEVDEWYAFFQSQTPTEIQKALIQRPVDSRMLLNMIKVVVDLENEKSLSMQWVDYFARARKRCATVERLWKFEAELGQAELEQMIEAERSLEAKKTALLSHLKRQILDEVGLDRAAGQQQQTLQIQRSRLQQPDLTVAPQSVHATENVRGTEQELRVLKALDFLDD